MAGQYRVLRKVASVPVTQGGFATLDLPRDRAIVLYCGTGARAGKAREILDAKGLKAFNGGGYKDVLKILEGAGKTPQARG